MRIKPNKLGILLTLSIPLGVLGIALADEPLTIHEWGTFTVLQDEAGKPLPGVNVNEERLPGFVFRLDSGIAPHSHALSPLAGRRSKGIPISFPAAIMRMETPIIYVYPPKSGASQKVNVSVRFHGGWISEWYPDATVVAPGFKRTFSSIGNLGPATTGSIRWNNVTIGTDRALPETGHHVWLAPRQVAAPRLSTEEGNVENYLFYRGVANIEAPLRVTRNGASGQFVVSRNASADFSPNKPSYNSTWLADIRADGALAFRHLEAGVELIGSSSSVITTPSEFLPSDYSDANRIVLRESMKKVLKGEGLWDDEADAMLNTWELSYFNSPGMRLFFSLPQSWTDQVLPLEVSQPADINRVMIGHIELVTPAHRRLLNQITAGPISTSSWFWDRLKTFSEDKQSRVWQEISFNRKSLADWDFEVPPDYQAFLGLGRFREAILLDELSRTNSPTLRQFVSNYRLTFRDQLRTAGVGGS